MSKSSLDNLIELLVNECAKNPDLSLISEETVKEIVNSLEKEIFAEDNRKSSISSLDKILDRIVDQIYEEGKK
jgi:predicted transcriptional regulator YheO